MMPNSKTTDRNPDLQRPEFSVAHLRHVPKRYYRRWAAAGLILAVFGFIAHAFATGQIEWDVVAKFFTASAIMEGLVNTVIMTVLAMILGIFLGVVFAIMFMSPNPVLKSVACFYIWFFRGTPLLLQLLLWFNLALVFPIIGIPGVFEYRTVAVITPFMATLLGLGINQGAYTAEVVRSGILSVDIGRTEAAKAIGMTRLTTLRRIVLPQAMRVIIPPVGNEVISMVKLTSMASVIQYRRDPAQRPEHLLRQRPGDRTVNRRGPVVSHRRDGSLGGPVFSRETLRQGGRWRQGPAPPGRENAMNTPPMVVAVNVHKYFGSPCALKNVSIEVAKGEVLCVIGPSGSGKSTFLRCINQLEKTDRGRYGSTANWPGSARSGMPCMS